MRILKLSCAALVLCCSSRERDAATDPSIPASSRAPGPDHPEVASGAPVAEVTGLLPEPAPSTEPEQDMPPLPGAVAFDAGGLPSEGPLGMPEDVLPSLAPSVVAFYDFEHPALPDETRELDRGLSGTTIELINGGAQMRVSDGAYAASRASLRVQQVGEATAGNDDWKAGIWDENGVATLSAFSGARGTTIMAWIQRTSDGPALDTNTADPSDRYNALGIAGILSGNSEGHGARALLELILVDGELRLVALGRRLDAGRSQTFAASDDYRVLLPVGEWVHIAATFDFGIGEMMLYRNGQPIGGVYTERDDPWELAGAVAPATSPTLPRGIKIGGSYPQNTQEFNPGQSKLDSVMFLDRVATPREIDQQYLLASPAAGRLP